MAGGIGRGDGEGYCCRSLQVGGVLHSPRAWLKVCLAKHAQTPCVHLLSKDKPIRGVSTICARNALPNPPRTRPWSMLFD